MQKVKPYAVLNIVYNHLMRKIRYDKWADYLYTLLKDQLPSKPEILELAAGNCILANNFSRYYNKIIVSDLNYEMLKSSVTNLPKVCCNMTAVPFNKQFDLLLSTFDSVNYLLTTAELKKLFAEADRILKPEGIFSFDVSLENNSYRHVNEAVREQRVKGIRYQHLSKYEPDTRIHTNKFILRFANGKIYSEIHKQKIYPFEKYFDIISGTGFYVAECFDSFSFKTGSASSERVQFVLKRNKKS